MKSRENNKNSLDSTGIELLEAARLRTDEIESIVSKTNLYDSILARVNADRTVVKESVRDGRQIVPYLQRASGVLAFGAVMSFVLFNFNNSRDSVPESSAVVKQSQVIGNADPSLPRGSVIADRVVESDAPSKFDMRSSRIAYRPKPPIKRRAAPPRSVPAAIDDSDDFYPVSYTGDPKELALGGRVVRVELSRASLFAMGVNLPLENDSAAIKTDLLIGSDGVTRGMRLVE